MSRYTILDPVQVSSALNPIESIWGELYNGCDLRLDRDVWLLKFRYDAANVNDRAAKYVSLASKIDDPSLFTVLDYDSDNNCLVTESAGESLRDFLLRRGALSQGVVRKFLAKTLRLFSKFEEKKFVHGDVRVDSFFLESNWKEPKKISDLPVKLFASLGYELDGVVLSQNVSVKYCAPEMCNPDFGFVTPLSDMYSLAFVALELLTGQDFDSHFNNELHLGAPNWTMIHGSVNAEELPPVKSFVPRIAPDLEDVLSSMLRRRPEERPQSAQLALEKLDFSTNDEGNYGEEEEEDDGEINSVSYVSVSDLGRDGLGTFLQPLSDGDSEEDDRKKSPFLLLKESVLKPYVLWPISSGVLVALTALIVSFFADKLEFRELNIQPKEMSVYARVFQVVDDASGSEKTTTEVSKRNKEGNASWMLPRSHRKYRVEIDGYVPKEAFLSQKIFAGKGEVDLSLEPLTITATIDSSEGVEFSAYCDGDVRLTKSNSLKSGNYRVGVFRAGFKPTELTAINTDRILPVPTEESRLNQEAEKVAEEVYRLLCAVPVEWQTVLPSGKYGEYDRICEEYFNLFNSDSGVDASVFEDARKRTLKFFEDAASALFDSRPIALSCSPNDVWNKTHKAFERIANIEKESGREGEWKPIDFWIPATNAQVFVEQACFSNDVRLLRDASDDESATDDAEEEVPNVCKEIKKAERFCETDEQRIILARVWARRFLTAQLMVIKEEYRLRMNAVFLGKKPSKYDLVDMLKKDDVTDSFVNAEKFLKELGENSPSEYSKNAVHEGYAVYLRACARLRGVLNGEISVADSDYKELDERFNAAIKYFESNPAKERFGDAVCSRRKNVALVLKSEVLSRLKRTEELGLNMKSIDLSNDVFALFACYYKFRNFLVDDTKNRDDRFETASKYYEALQTLLNNSKKKTSNVTSKEQSSTEKKLGDADFLDGYISNVDGEFLPCVGYVHRQFCEEFNALGATDNEKKTLKKSWESASDYVEKRRPLLPSAPLVSAATTL